VQTLGRKAIGVGWVLAFTWTGCWGLLRYSGPPYTATVTAATWQHVIDIERYAFRTQEGFKEAIPADAIDVKRIGKRVHHHDKVLTGYETQSFVDTKPDGTRDARGPQDALRGGEDPGADVSGRAAACGGVQL
jgi:hypothetical protein